MTYEKRELPDVSLARLTGNPQFVRFADRDLVYLHELGEDWQRFYGYAITRSEEILNFRRRLPHAKASGSLASDYVDFSAPARVNKGSMEKREGDYYRRKFRLRSWDMDLAGAIQSVKATGVIAAVMICTTWHGERPSENHVAAHINGDPTDNRPENLVWATRTENWDDAAVHRAMDLIGAASSEQVHPSALNPGLKALVRSAHDYYARMSTR